MDPRRRRIVRRVLAWYDANARDLPWRASDATPWGVLVSEIMLQQTPVARVQPAWESWLRRWPTPGALAAASTADVLRAWDRLGYPRRALRLQAAAAVIATQHDDRVPSELDALLALPGVGSYTAAAVASFAYGRRHVVLDTNVRRVLGRLDEGIALPGSAPTRAERERAAAYLPDDAARAARWNVGAMELGALLCRAAAPDCGACPVRDDCTWFAVGRPPAARRPRAQAWEGTDRQCRGRILAAARAGGCRVADCEPYGADPAQVARCLTGLVADGLVAVVDGSVVLPGEGAPAAE